MNINKNPLVSIFILCYNHEKYVAEAIESVINQTYSNIELIIVDNASTDHSRAVIESYARQDKRIKFFPMEHNSFPSAGSNFAIKQCSGEYICGLSADDFFVLDKIAIQLNYMLSNNLSNTFTWVKVIDDSGQELLDHWANHLFNRNFSEYELEKYFITHGNTICAITWMFHKSIFDKYGYFDHRLLQTQDFDLWLRIVRKEKINLLSKKLTCYRVRNDGNNLSINMDSKASLRSWFEATYYIRHVLDFDTHLLSEITGETCNENNKYIQLFKYYKTKNIIPYAVAVLYAMYEKLGSDFQFPSPLYLDFFEAHSTFDFMGAFENRSSDLAIQLFLDHGNGISEENSIKLPVAQHTDIQEFVFDLSGKSAITNLRLDPLNDSCVIEIEKIVLVINQVEIDLREQIMSNAPIQQGKKYFFDHNDPQLYFHTMTPDGFSEARQLIVAIKYSDIGKDALMKCLSQTKIELDQIRTSLSWKITQPLRKIKQILKGV